MTQTADSTTASRLDRTYRASDRIVGVARAVVLEQASAWSLPDEIRDKAVRVCSEFMTNAIAVSRADQHVKIRFELFFPVCALLSVWDSSPRPARLKAPDLHAPIDAEPDDLLKALDEIPDFECGELPSLGGWGLNLVGVLADATGAYWPAPIPKAGKWMWARFEF